MLRRGGNVLRWRWGEGGPGGEREAQSNARLVKWSDGTASVMLGDQVCGAWARGGCMVTVHGGCVGFRMGGCMEAACNVL